MFIPVEVISDTIHLIKACEIMQLHGKKLASHLTILTPCHDGKRVLVIVE